MRAKRALPERTTGFTLIEIMIVVAIIGILASIAYSSYMDNIRSTRVGQAKEGAMQVATVLERKAASDNAYPANLTGIKQPYSDLSGSSQVTYTYTQTDSGGNYTLQASNDTLGIKAWINSQGTRCFCDGKSCSSGSLAAKATSCSSGTAF